MRSAQRLILARDLNLLKNGSFDVGTVEWALSLTGGSPSFTSVGGVGRISLPAAGFGVYWQAIPTIIGRSYRATGNLPGSTGTVTNYLCRKSDDANVSSNVATLKTGAGTFDILFTATAAVTYISVQLNASTAATADFDSLRVVPA
jgi:hypothetical protein